MPRKRYVIIEFFVGVIMLAVGAGIYGWKSQLIWTMIYPPPVEKQVLDAVPYLFWIVGLIFIVDSVRRRFL